ncbi:response regulator [Phenylobacterium montanum]|uniref:Regulatory protein VirG n=1 Tax=Phenylobacterium montanum TaxID=2823693 RepID=A0A975FY41_9CAUL|nr:response regulator transcription factor [Caulobacter sp. S6]QUD87560.1 response regulator transcription factor [Caulobacter sp. S6]
MTDRILLIDDDVRLADMVRAYLAQVGYAIDARHTGEAGVRAVAERPAGEPGYDVVILDIMLPDMDGLEVCRRLRARTDVPILMLSARGEDTDRIVGLEMGADDYLPKPFNPRELHARLKAILRRRHGPQDLAGGALRFGRLEIDPSSRAVRIDGGEVALTSYQFDLLLALAHQAGKVMSRERLMDLVKGAELEAFDRSIDVHISRIRAAIEDDPGHPRRIITVRGSGYLFARVQDQG